MGSLGWAMTSECRPPFSASLPQRALESHTTRLDIRSSFIQMTEWSQALQLCPPPPPTHTHTNLLSHTHTGSFKPSLFKLSCSRRKRSPLFREAGDTPWPLTATDSCMHGAGGRLVRVLLTKHAPQL
jgi:hypothetical protein